MSIGDDHSGSFSDGGELTGSKKKRGRRKRKRKRKPRRLTLAVLPTLLTLGNAVCGLAAIAILLSNAESIAWAPEQKLFVAGLLIYGGMLFDGLDGSAARMTGQSSEFGAQLDSLCDAVTFGTAPAVIIWKISDSLPQRLTWGIGVLFTLCVLIRLARFNVETSEDDTHEGFEGLPSPAAAGTVAAFAIAIPELQSVATDTLYPERIQALAQTCLWASHYVIPILALLLAYLMVSRFQYPHVLQQWMRGRRSMQQFGQALFMVFGVVLLHWLALPLALSYFAFASPVSAMLKNAKNRDADQSEDALTHPRVDVTDGPRSNSDDSGAKPNQVAAKSIDDSQP
jgi:CDP-diacylglycerol--serine O-phosphatidyltransferase